MHHVDDIPLIGPGEQDKTHACQRVGNKSHKNSGVLHLGENSRCSMIWGHVDIFFPR